VNNNVHIRVLLGDTNGTGAVSVADVNQTRSRSGQMADASNFRSDTNCTGSISVADVNQVRSRSATRLSVRRAGSTRRHKPPGPFRRTAFPAVIERVLSDHPHFAGIFLIFNSPKT